MLLLTNLLLLLTDLLTDIGGMCACRCSGSTAIKYGSMRVNVLNITVVLADGAVLNRPQ